MIYGLMICSLAAGCGGAHRLAVSIGISPSGASLDDGGNKVFTATVSNDSTNAGVTWSVSSGPGKLSGITATSATYIAPSPISSDSTAMLTATSVADTTKSSSAIITLTPTPKTITSVAISCLSVSVEVGQTLQCVATVSGTGAYNPTVNWSASPGTIDSTGLFTATTIGNATVTATSIQDAGKSGNTAVSVTVPTAAITFQDSFNYLDGTQLSGQTAPTGQTWGVTGYNLTDAQVWQDRLISYPTSAEAGPWYAYVNTGSNVHSYSATFTLVADAGSAKCNGAAMIIYGDTTNITNKMIHAIIDCNSAYVTWWNGTSQNNSPAYSSSINGDWTSAMTMAPGGTYTVTLSWDGGDWVYVTGPDGGIISLRDPNFALAGGAGIIWETSSSPTEPAYPALSNVTVTQ
jgi:hypothetical protein